MNNTSQQTQDMNSQLYPSSTWTWHGWNGQGHNYFNCNDDSPACSNTPCKGGQKWTTDESELISKKAKFCCSDCADEWVKKQEHPPRCVGCNITQENCLKKYDGMFDECGLTSYKHDVNDWGLYCADCISDDSSDRDEESEDLDCGCQSCQLEQLNQLYDDDVLDDKEVEQGKALLFRQQVKHSFYGKSDIPPYCKKCKGCCDYTEDEYNTLNYGPDWREQDGKPKVYEPTGCCHNMGESFCDDCKKEDQLEKVVDNEGINKLNEWRIEQLEEKVKELEAKLRTKGEEEFLES